MTDNLAIMDRTDYSILPSHMQEGAKLYVQRGIRPGRFLFNILRNDFVSAACCADQVNMRSLDAWARFLYNAPAMCWGDDDRVNKWIEFGGLEGLPTYQELQHAQR